MAIKLEVSQTSQSNMNYTGSAVSMKSDRNFGNMVAGPIQLPRANASGEFQANMQMAESIGDSYRAIAKTLSNVSENINGFLLAEDENNANNIRLNLKAKQSEINAKNMERHANGELKLHEVMTENKRMFDEEYRTQIENTKFSFGTTRDKLDGLANLMSAQQYEQDMNAYKVNVVQQLKEDYVSSMTKLKNQSVNSVNDWNQAYDEGLVMANTNKTAVNVIGTNTTVPAHLSAMQESARTLLKNEITTDPYIAEEKFKSGIYEKMMSVLPESERPLYEKEIQDQKRNVEVRTLQDENRKSVEWASNALLDMASGKKIYTQDEILNGPGQPDEKLRVLNARHELVRKQEAEYADYKDLTDEYSRVGGTGLTNEKMNKLFLLTDGGQTLKNIRENPETAYAIGHLEKPAPMRK